MTYEIKHKDGTTIAAVNSLTYSDKRMGEEYVTMTISSAEPIAFEIGDYVTYRGSEFYLNTKPSMKRRARNGSVGDALTYEGVKFMSARSELTDCTFLDVVVGDNQLHTALPEFSFYASSVRMLGERIEKNMQRIDSRWKVVYGGGLTGAKTNITVAVNNISCWDALALAKSEFGVNFSVTGRTVTIGDVENALNSEALRYGKGKGCVTIERTADDQQQVITRLRAYGNTTNMPTRFYANRDVVCTLPIAAKSVMEIRHEWFEGVEGLPEEITGSEVFNANPRYWVSVFNAIGKQLSEYDGCVVGSTEMHMFPPSCFNAYDEDTKTSVVTATNGKKYVIAAYHQYNFVLNYVFAINATKEEAEALSEIKLNISVNKDAWPADYKSGAKLPNNLHIDRVMLPSFPEVQYPYLEKNVETLGVREATVYFDGSDDREDIYPTIEGIDVMISRGSGLTDNGMFGTDSTTETVPPFEVEITFADSVADNMVFDPWDYRVAGDKPKLAMKDGMCMGREFEIIKCKQKEGSARTYVLTCNRTEDTGLRLYFPYSQYNVSAGDKFVLLGISMPAAYVDAAAERLEKAAKAYLDANCDMRYKYALRMSSIYVHSGRNWHDTICAGQVVKFHDDDVVGSDDVRYPIDSIEIKEGESGLPAYNIVLSDEPSVSTITRIMNSVNAVEQSAITEIHPLFIRREGALVGIYNPAEKALTLELGAAGEGDGEGSGGNEVVSGDSYFEKYKVGTKTVQEQKKDDEGNLVFVDADGNETTEADGNEPLMVEMEVDETAIKLKDEYVGLFSPGFLSAYGINGTGGGSGSGTGAYPRLDSWAQYIESGEDEDGNPIVGTEQWVLSAKLGWELYNNGGGGQLSPNEWTQKAAFTDKKGLASNLGYELYEKVQEISETTAAALSLLEYKIRTIKPNLFWANLPTQSEAKTDTEPVFGAITIGGAKITWDPANQCLVSDKGVVSLSFVSAYGLNGENNSGGTGSIVSFTPSLESGTIIGTITINGKPQYIYAPNGGASQWSEITGKPFVSIGTGLTVTNGVLSATATGGVTSVGGKTGEITLLGGQTTDGSINLAMSDKQMQAILVGWDKLALKTEIPVVPTNISAFANDSGYLTSVAFTDLPKLYWANVEVGSKENTETAPTFLNAFATNAVAIGTPEREKSAYLQVASKTGVFTIERQASTGYSLLYTNKGGLIILGGNAGTGTSINTPLIVDGGNNRVGIDVMAPEAALHVKGSIMLQNGSNKVTLSVDANGNLKVNKGLYSESFVSAYGLNGENAGAGSNVTISGLLNSGTTIGTITVDGKDYVLKAPSNSGTETGNYLSLNGGTLTNASIGAQLEIYRSSNNGISAIKYSSRNNSGTKYTVGYIGLRPNLSGAENNYPVWSNDASTWYKLWSEKDYSLKTISSAASLNAAYSAVATDNKIVPTMAFLSWWNGRYNSTSSNLAYCNQGAFGTAVTHDHGDYVTALSFSSNKLQWSKGGTAQTGITIGYAASAGSATTADSATTAGSCTGNAATATKLASAVTLWGQDFDGSKNVTGNMTSVGSISASDNIYISAPDATANTGFGVSTSNGGMQMIVGSSNKGLWDNEAGYWILARSSEDRTKTKIPDKLCIGDFEAYFWYDSANKCIRTNVGFASNSFVSAYGLNGNSELREVELHNDGSNVARLRLGNVGQISATSQNTAAASRKMSIISNYGVTFNWEKKMDFSGADASSFSVDSDTVTLTSNGNLTLSASSQYKLTASTANVTVSGTLTVNKNWTTSSDMRLKNVRGYIDLSVSDIADAPVFEYSLKEDTTGMLAVGSSAQYWEKILPVAVKEGGNGYLTLDYTGVTMAACVALAKQSVNHEDRIKALEEENVRLKNRIVELEK